jgi:transcriptional regulator GlxA family with amidase domain
MTPSVQLSTVTTADELLPAKQATRSGRETMATWQALGIQAYIASHLHSTIRVMDLVRTVQLPPNRFFPLFKKRFGCTPHQYVMRARIARAQRLLLMSEDTLNEIAAECGFGNKSHLVNLFRNATGRPPGQWRRLHATPCGVRPMIAYPEEGGFLRREPARRVSTAAAGIRETHRMSPGTSEAW